VRCPL